jgi:hypothetical protein
VQQATRERNGALRAAADTIESTKRVLFASLQPTTQTVVLDDRGTAETTDDVTGTMQILFYDTEGNPLATVPLDLSMVIVEARVSWNPAGRRSTAVQTVSLRTLLAP